MTIAGILSTLLVAALAVACSTLKVLPGTESKGGVPFYLSQHEFLISELDLDDDGNPATIKPLRITLVKRADSTRLFLLNHAPAWFSSSEFSLERDEEGRLVSVFGKTDEKALEAATAIAGLVVRAGAMAITGRSEADLREVLTTQVAVRKRLLDSLRDATDVNKIKHIQESLALTEERISSIESELKQLASAKVKVGTVASQNLASKTVAVSSGAIANAEAKKLGEGEIGIYLVPVK